MKKLTILLFFILSIGTFALPSTSGATGTIEFPDAYTLRISNYTVAGALTGIDKDTAFQLMLEGGFIPQVEAGIVLTSKNTMIDQSLLKANVKFQFVQEADNPAIALGFVEAKDSLKGETVYGYLVGSKKLKDLFSKDNFIEATLGMKYDKDKDVDGFAALDIPIFQMIKINLEGYTYRETVIEKSITTTSTGQAIETKKSKKETRASFNVGGEFYTNQSIRTKVWWKEIDNTVGLSVAYIGIYK